MDFYNFFSIHVFQVEESIAEILIRLPCLGDLKNVGQLPVQKAFKGTDSFVSWIYTVSSVSMFSMSSY